MKDKYRQYRSILRIASGKQENAISFLDARRDPISRESAEVASGACVTASEMQAPEPVAL